MIKTEKKTPLTLGTKIGIAVSGVILLITALIVGMVVYDATKTYPLGDDGRVVYLGKEHNGDGIVAPSYDVYYYGTNMSMEELAGYFGGEVKEATSAPDDHDSFNLVLPNNKSIPLTFYYNKNSEYGTPIQQTKNITQRFFFSLSSPNYKMLKDQIH